VRALACVRVCDRKMQLDVHEFANCLKYIGVSARHLVQVRARTRT
jgi:hypothetical protein